MRWTKSSRDQLERTRKGTRGCLYSGATAMHGEIQPEGHTSVHVIVVHSVLRSSRCSAGPNRLAIRRLQILLLTLVVDQTQVFPSTTLLFLSSTGRCQIPKTAVAAGGLLVRSPVDMPDAKGGAKTHLSEARRKANRKTNTQTYCEKHCATVATFQWPGAYVFAHGKSHQYSISHALSQSPLGAEWHRTGQHTRFLVGLRGRNSFRALDTYLITQTGRNTMRHSETRQYVGTMSGQEREMRK